MDTTDILLKAKDLLLFSGWTKKTSARRANGTAIRGSDSWDEAVSFCSLGAIWKAADCKATREYVEAERLLRKAMKEEIPSWNDNVYRTLDEVLDAFDAAICLSEDESV